MQVLSWCCIFNSFKYSYHSRRGADATGLSWLTYSSFLFPLVPILTMTMLQTEQIRSTTANAMNSIYVMSQVGFVNLDLGHSGMTTDSRINLERPWRSYHGLAISWWYSIILLLWPHSWQLLFSCIVFLWWLSSYTTNQLAWKLTLWAYHCPFLLSLHKQGGCILWYLLLASGCSQPFNHNNNRCSDLHDGKERWRRSWENCMQHTTRSVS